MRLLLLFALAFTSTVAAQGAYLGEGRTGLSVGASFTPALLNGSNGDLLYMADLSATVSPRVDLAASYAIIDPGPDGGVSALSATLYPVAGPTWWVGPTVGLAYSTVGYGADTFISGGLGAAYRAEVSDVLTIVPQAAVSVSGRLVRDLGTRDRAVAGGVGAAAVYRVKENAWLAFEPSVSYEIADGSTFNEDPLFFVGGRLVVPFGH